MATVREKIDAMEQDNIELSEALRLIKINVTLENMVDLHKAIDLIVDVGRRNDLLLT
jgi:hypothetical protein